MNSSNKAYINLDAWSDGQIRSKIWLCEELEKISVPAKHYYLWIYGSWYGTLAQFILIRRNLNIKKFHLFDIDDEALEISKSINATWWINNITQFCFYKQDCNEITTDQILLEKPDFIINTSCEHFENTDWFKNLPIGQKFIVQSTNMRHSTHILTSENLIDFKQSLGSISEIYYEGKLSFQYPDFEFDRFMIIGIK